VSELQIAAPGFWPAHGTRYEVVKVHESLNSPSLYAAETALLQGALVKIFHNLGCQKKSLYYTRQKRPFDNPFFAEYLQKVHNRRDSFNDLHYMRVKCGFYTPSGVYFLK